MAFKALIYGEAGTGKTCSLRTLLNCGQKVRFLAAENNAIEGIKTALHMWEKETKKPYPSAEDFALMIPSRPKRTINDLVKTQEKFIKVPLETAMKSVDPDRNKFTRYLEVLRATVNFKDTASGTDFGCIDDWDDSVTLAIDGLTIICEAISQATVGGKLTISQPEWGAMQKTLVEFMRQLTEDLNCNLVVLAHPVKETDAILGTQRIYPANLGQALNNSLPSFFTEVIYSFRSGKEFLWSTNHKQAVTRQTTLPLEEKMPQDFSQLLRKRSL